MKYNSIPLPRRAFLAGTLAAVAMGALAGCSNVAVDPSEKSAEANRREPDPAAEPVEASGPQSAAARGASLIVYFSHQGTTRAIAETIQKRTGADIFEIVPETPYPEGTAGAASVAEGELDSDARPAIRGTVENIDDYDTLFLGYPIWYGTVPMVIGSFLETHDLAGKTIQPFCTSSYNAINEGSIDFIRKLALNSTVTDGLTANDEEALETWLALLGY